MAALALADLLPDFGSARGGTVRPVLQPVPEPFMEQLQAPSMDVSAKIAEAVGKAEASVTERLSAIYEATLEAERNQHSSERDELRRSLGTEAAGLIEARFAAMEKQLTALTATAVARILGGVLTEEIQKRAVAALSAKIDDALKDADAVRIRVVGPQVLWEALSAAIGDRAGVVEFAERASFDLTVTIDSSIYETRLAEWSAELAGVLA